MSRWSLCALLAVAVLLTAAILCRVQAAPENPFSDDPASPPVKTATEKPQPKKLRAKKTFAVKSLPKNPAPAKELRTGEAAIEQALKSPTDMEFVETPLDQVIDYLRDFHQIEIQLDKTAMEDLGIDTCTPVTKNLKGITLRSGLQLMLRELKLTYTIKNDVLLITTPEVEESNLITRVYDVADLVVCMDDKFARCDDYDSLIDVISNAIQPTTWDSVGGPGSISGKSLGTAKVLVVAQTYEVHSKILDLLKEIRSVAAKHSGEGLPRRNQIDPTILNQLRGCIGMSGGPLSPTTDKATQKKATSGEKPAVPGK